MAFNRLKLNLSCVRALSLNVAKSIVNSFIISTIIDYRTVSLLAGALYDTNITNTRAD